MLLSPTAGATGLVGSRLVAKLAAQGHTARVLTRNVDAARAKLPFPRTEFFAPPQWGNAVRGARGVVNLAGAPQLRGGCVGSFCCCGRDDVCTRRSATVLASAPRLSSGFIRQGLGFLVCPEEVLAPRLRVALQ